MQLAACALIGFVAIGQRHDEVMDLGGPRCVLNLLIAGVHAAYADVVGDRAFEQSGVLIDHGHQGAQGLIADIADIGDRKSTRLNYSHSCASRMPSSARKKKSNLMYHQHTYHHTTTRK